MAKNLPVPDADTLGRISELAAVTARRHLEAAKCLLDHGFWGEAHALAVIGFEEIGKAWLTMIATLSPGELRQEFPFASLGWDHLGKLGAARAVHALLAFVRGGEGAPTSAAEAVADLDPLAREDNKAKQRGLYTDYADGAARSPADITDEQARAMVAVVQDALDHAGPVIDLATARWASNNLPDSALSFLEQVADAVQVGDDAVEAVMQGGLRSSDPIVGLVRDDPEWVRGIITTAREVRALRTEGGAMPEGCLGCELDRERGRSGRVMAGHRWLWRGSADLGPSRRAVTDGPGGARPPDVQGDVRRGRLLARYRRRRRDSAGLG